MTQQTGSIPYMAPEVMESREYCDKCDIYSFGMTLYHMVVRESPFPHEQWKNNHQIVFQVCQFFQIKK